MKKILSFSTLMAFIGLVMLFLFFTPCYVYTNPYDSVSQCTVNMFQAAFGSTISWAGFEAAAFTTPACVGLILAFVFLILGIVLNLAANKIKLLNFLAFGFYLTSAILIFCGINLILASSAGAVPTDKTLPTTYQGFATTIGVFLCIISGGSLISSIAGLFKPKAKEVY